MNKTSSCSTSPLSTQISFTLWLDYCYLQSGVSGVDDFRANMRRFDSWFYRPNFLHSYLLNTAAKKIPNLSFLGLTPRKNTSKRFSHPSVTPLPDAHRSCASDPLLSPLKAAPLLQVSICFSSKFKVSEVRGLGSFFFAVSSGSSWTVRHFKPF